MISTVDGSEWINFAFDAPAINVSYYTLGRETFRGEERLVLTVKDLRA